jgi:hypothetical protein
MQWEIEVYDNMWEKRQNDVRGQRIELVSAVMCAVGGRGVSQRIGQRGDKR